MKHQQRGSLPCAHIYLVASFLLMVLAFNPLHAETRFAKLTASPNSAFVAQLYRDLLGRSPKAGEVKPLVTSINGGTTRSQTSQAAGGLYVASGDVTGSGKVGIIVGQATGSSGQVRIRSK